MKWKNHQSNSLIHTPSKSAMKMHLLRGKIEAYLSMVEEDLCTKAVKSQVKCNGKYRKVLLKINQILHNQKLILTLNKITKLSRT